MSYPTSGSTINNKINSSLNTNIVIKVGLNTIGAIQNLTIRQNKDIAILEEIGTEGVVDSHPKNAAKITATIRRIVYDQLSITEAFGRGFINLQSQRFPFDIHIIDMSAADEDGNDAVITVLNNCWFKSFETPYDVGGYLIVQSAEINCEYITTTRNSESAANGGARDVNYEYDSIERITDTTGKQGRFDI